MTVAAKTKLQSFPLRISDFTLEKACILAYNEGISLNHFISLAVEAKISHAEQSTRLTSTP